MRVRKTRDVWRLFVNYGQGWEHEITEFTFSEGRARAREYRENCPQYPVKLKHGRERIEPPDDYARCQTCGEALTAGDRTLGRCANGHGVVEAATNG